MAVNADLTTLSGFLTSVSTDAASEFGGMVTMPAPTGPVIEALRRLALELSSCPADSPMAVSFAKEMAGKERQLLAALQQPHVASHPTASADILALLSTLIACPRSAAAKVLTGEDVCAAIDASAQCEFPDTAVAAARLVVAVSRQPAMQQILLTDRALGCVFALHDRTGMSPSALLSCLRKLCSV